MANFKIVKQMLLEKQYILFCILCNIRRCFIHDDSLKTKSFDVDFPS